MSKIANINKQFRWFSQEQKCCWADPDCIMNTKKYEENLITTKKSNYIIKEKKKSHIAINNF